MPSLSPSVWGLVLLAVFGTLYFLRFLPTVTAVLGFIGVVLLGTTGWIGGLLTGITNWVVGLVGHAVGTAAGIGIFVILAIVFGHDLHKDHQTKQRTAWAGIALGALVVAGVTGIPALAGLHNDITNAFSTVAG